MTGGKRRFVAMITALAMVFAVAFSALFVMHESEHQCSHVDCQICAQINACLKFFENTTPKPETAAFFAVLTFAPVLALGALLVSFNKKTLIDLKIKLSD